jgi:hypothetical protein
MWNRLTVIRVCFALLPVLALVDLVTQAGSKW